MNASLISGAATTSTTNVAAGLHTQHDKHHHQRRRRRRHHQLRRRRARRRRCQVADVIRRTPHTQTTKPRRRQNVGWPLVIIVFLFAPRDAAAFV